MTDGQLYYANISDEERPPRTDLERAQTELGAQVMFVPSTQLTLLYLVFQQLKRSADLQEIANRNTEAMRALYEARDQRDQRERP